MAGSRVALLIAAHKTACALCGETDPVVLQFQHRDPATKRFDIASGARTKGYATMAAELAKCVVLCANCHLRVHAGTKELPEC
jgi:hypothetical protein